MDVHLEVVAPARFFGATSAVTVTGRLDARDGSGGVVVELDTSTGSASLSELLDPFGVTPDVTVTTAGLFVLGAVPISDRSRALTALALPAGVVTAFLDATAPRSINPPAPGQRADPRPLTMTDDAVGLWAQVDLDTSRLPVAGLFDGSTELTVFAVLSTVSGAIDRQGLPSTTAWAQLGAPSCSTTFVPSSLTLDDAYLAFQLGAVDRVDVGAEFTATFELGGSRTVLFAGSLTISQDTAPGQGVTRTVSGILTLKSGPTSLAPLAGGYDGGLGQPVPFGGLQLVVDHVSTPSTTTTVCALRGQIDVGGIRVDAWLVLEDSTLVLADLCWTADPDPVPVGPLLAAVTGVDWTSGVAGLSVRTFGIGWVPSSAPLPSSTVGALKTLLGGDGNGVVTPAGVSTGLRLVGDFDLDLGAALHTTLTGTIEITPTTVTATITIATLPLWIVKATDAQLTIALSTSVRTMTISAKLSLFGSAAADASLAVTDEAGQTTLAGSFTIEDTSVQISYGPGGLSVTSLPTLGSAATKALTLENLITHFQDVMPNCSVLPPKSLGKCTMSASLSPSLALGGDGKPMASVDVTLTFGVTGFPFTRTLTVPAAATVTDLDPDWTFADFAEQVGSAIGRAMTGVAKAVLNDSRSVALLLAGALTSAAIRSLADAECDEVITDGVLALALTWAAFIAASESGGGGGSAPLPPADQGSITAVTSRDDDVTGQVVVTMTWTAVDGATGYTCAVDTTLPSVAVAPPTTTGDLVIPADWVAAANSAVSLTATVAGTTDAPAYWPVDRVATPSPGVGVPGADGLPVLTWAAVDRATAYRVYVTDTHTNPPTTSPQTVSDTRWSPDAPVTTQLQVRVQAVGDSRSLVSSGLSAMVIVNPPGFTVGVSRLGVDTRLQAT